MPEKQQSAIEVQRQARQAALDSRKPAAERNRLGQFSTPYALAVEIARYVKSVAGNRLRTVRFADPALGTGSFYSAALAVFGSGISRQRKRKPTTIGKRPRCPWQRDSNQTASGEAGAVQ